MDLDTYIELTGKNVPESQTAFYKASLKRVISRLETILGWSFTPQVLYQELGKSARGCICPDIPQTLLPPDEVKGIIKVFPYNSKDKFLHVDPFLKVYNVKLVKVNENREFITYKDFEFFNPQYGMGAIGRYIERCETCFCDCDCKDCVQLAVDGEWLSWESAPEELLYLICDMLDYQVDPTRDIKSESVDGHSWSRGDVKAPEATDESIRILARYAGPFGTINRIPTV